MNCALSGERMVPCRANRVAAIWLLTVFATGCLGLEKEYPIKRYYSIEVERERMNPAATGPGLEVALFEISRRFSDRFLVSRVAESRYESSFYEEHFADPAVTLTEQARGWLGNCGVFQWVASPGRELAADYVLDGVVTEIYADRRDPSAETAVLGMQFFLTARDLPGPHLAFQQEYESHQILGGNSAADLVDGWNRGLSEILGNLEADLGQVVSDAAESTQP